MSDTTTPAAAPAAPVIKPSVGRIVHYYPDQNIAMFKGQEECAAIITKVHSDTEVNLTVFGDGHMASTCVSHVSLRKEAKQMAAWGWPPRV